MKQWGSSGFSSVPRWGFAVLLTALSLNACSPERPQTAGQKATAISDALATAANDTPVGRDTTGACGGVSPVTGVEAIATRKLDSLRFAWRIRCVRRVAQRPATLRIDEFEEVVAWREGNGHNARKAEAVFVAVSHEPPSDTADARGVWPAAAILAALDALNEDQDALRRSVVLTMGSVPAWDILDTSAPDDTVPGALDSEYRSLLEATADSGPSPPLARPRQPGIVIGLIAESDLPVLSHDPRNRMLAEGSVFGHNAWNVPDGVSLRTSGDMLVLGVAEGVSADDDEALSDLTGVVVRALETADEWTGSARLVSSLPWDWQTISWLLGIVLPIVFLGFGTWCLVAKSLTNINNAKRALRCARAEVVRHLLWHKRSDRRTRLRIARTGQSIDLVNRKVDRAEHLRSQLAGRIKGLDHVPGADNNSLAKTTRAAPRLRKATRRRRALKRRLEVQDGHLQGLKDHLELLNGHLKILGAARRRAETERAEAEHALLDFPFDGRHGRGSHLGVPDDASSAVEQNGSADPSASGREKVAKAISGIVHATRLTRLWLWVLRVLGTPRARAAGHPRERKPEFVRNMRSLASCLVCHRRHSRETYGIKKKRGQQIVSGVWNGVWRAITSRKGARAFGAGAVSVMVALVLPGVAVQLWSDSVAATESNPAVALLVVFVYWWFRRYEQEWAVVWGAAAVMMLGLTTIEFTALNADLADVFDSQRVTVMQFVIVAMLFIGQEFRNRAAIGQQQELNADQEKLAELLRRADSDLSRCLRKGPRSEGFPDAPGDFKRCVGQAGARFVSPENRQRVGVWVVVGLYLAVCVHFVIPALKVQIHGDALNVVVVAGTVILLPAFSLWSTRKAARWQPFETKGGADV